jgi:hypothetical protein
MKKRKITIIALRKAILAAALLASGMMSFGAALPVAGAELETLKLRDFG